MRILASKVSYLFIAGLLVVSGCGGKGDKGDPGAKGNDGTNGSSGRNGDAGLQGIPGVNGTSGTNGADGDDGADGDAGLSTAPLNISVTNSLSGAAVSGAKISLAPATVAALTTDASGKVSAKDVPIGAYTLTLTATGYTTATQTVSLAAGVAANVVVKLVPTSKVVANAGADQTGKAPGSTVSLTGASTVLDGSTGAAYSWTQTEGPTVAITGANTANPSLTLPSEDAIKAAVLKDLSQPVRLSVVGINPHAIEIATTVTLQLTVTTSSGSYTDTVIVAATSPYQVTTGLRNVPIGIPQLLQAAALPSSATAWNWTLDKSGAVGSAATISAPGSQYPTFTPDAVGQYVLTETATGGSIKLYAGKWSAAIGSLSATDGLPNAPSDSCGLCHNGVVAPNKWADWRKSGHAEIFSQNIDDPANHWTVGGCASCHTVGYNTLASANNDGVDDYVTLSGWTQPVGAAGNYAAMFKNANANVVKLAQLANVQCDSCHGPTNSLGHSAGKLAATMDQSARVSAAAEVCGSCHGEPLRHGRYQQWQESGHGNSALAISRADAKASSDNATTGDNSVNSCARCHSAEGFIVWQAQSQARGGDYNKVIQGAANNGNNGNATGAELRAMGLTAANVHSQTCTACHDPHTQGDLSGEPNTATLRIASDVAMSAAGIPLVGLGKGVLCATCHNSRNGLHNDSVTSYGASGVAAPHDSTVADVLLGENVYFVPTGQRGGHSYITNTCANCHMELTPPPAEFSYQLSGTNHSFNADLSICTNCHGAFDGGSIQTATKASLTNLTKYIGAQAAKALNGKVFWTRARRIPASATDTTAVYSHATSTDLSQYNVLVDLTAGTNSITSAVLLENSTNIQITFANPIDITWTDRTSAESVTSIIVTLATMKLDDGTGTTPAATIPVSLTGNLAKALWNYIELYREGSFGIHNPGFTNQVIGATLGKDLTL